MGSLGMRLAHPVGFVDLENVWLDDRATCRWGLEGVSVVIEPGQTVVVLDDEPHGAVAHDILDLVSARRTAVRGVVSIDGIAIADLDPASRDAAIAELAERGPAGERRVVIAGRTTLVAQPRPLTLQAADRVIVVAHGQVVADGDHRQLMLAGGRYARRFGEATAA